MKPLTPSYDDGQAIMYLGDALKVMRRMPTASVDVCVTSPPYWLLRSGVPGVYGLEPTPEAYIRQMVRVFREVHRILRPGRTLFLNIGDGYATKRRGNDLGWRSSRLTNPGRQQKAHAAALQPNRLTPKAYGLQHKQMIGMPWRLAFALQKAGWWLRQEVIWDKPNPQPEAVKDRFTNSHERLFLLSNAERYYWNGDAVQEPASPDTHMRISQNALRAQDGGPKANRDHGDQPGRMARERNPRVILQGMADRAAGVNPKSAGATVGEVRSNASMSAAISGPVLTRNPRTVWRVSTVPNSFGWCAVCDRFWEFGAPAQHCGQDVEGHYATFPPELVRVPILAGCPPGGTVFDPFSGSGTVGEVAKELGMNAVLIDLDPKCLRFAQHRLSQMSLRPPADLPAAPAPEDFSQAPFADYFQWLEQ